MSWTDLPTNYTDAEYTGLKKYQMLDNGDGTVSFRDVTEYTQEENSFFGADDANAMNGAINEIMTNGVIGDAPSDNGEYVRKNRAWVANSGGQSAKTFWVNALTGDDSNEGTSAAPFKKIQKAINSLSSIGGTIYIQGSFTETPYITGKEVVNIVVSANTSITYSSSADSTISINNSNVTISASSGITLTINNALSLSNNSYVLIKMPVTISRTNTVPVIDVDNSRLVVANALTINNGYSSNPNNGIGIRGMTSSTIFVYDLTINANIGGMALTGSTLSYGSLSGTRQTSDFVTDTGGRVYTGSQS